MDKPMSIITTGQINDQVTPERMPKFFNKNAKPVMNKIVPINIIKNSKVKTQKSKLMSK